MLQKWARESTGLKSPTDNALVGRVRDGAKRILGTERANRKEPLPLGVLKAIVGESDLSDCLVLRNVCLYFCCVLLVSLDSPMLAESEEIKYPFTKVL